VRGKVAISGEKKKEFVQRSGRGGLHWAKEKRKEGGCHETCGDSKKVISKKKWLETWFFREKKKKKGAVLLNLRRGGERKAPDEIDALIFRKIRKKKKKPSRKGNLTFRWKRDPPPTPMNSEKDGKIRITALLFTETCKNIFLGSKVSGDKKGK